MSYIDWFDFVQDVEIQRDATSKKVSALMYNGIEIHPYPGTRLVGAYKFERESEKDSWLIRYFENHGVIVNALIKAIEEGIASAEAEPLEVNMPTYIDKNLYLLAFERGQELKDK